MNEVKKYWKSIVAFITPGVVALAAAVTDQSPGGQVITEAEWIGIGAAMLVTGGAVLAAPKNRSSYEVPEPDPTSDDLEINEDQPDVPDAKPEHAAV